MRFVSKNANYRVVLKPGQPAEPLTGRLAVPALYIKFEDGMVDIKDEELCQKMLNHSAYGTDFVSTEKEEDKWSKTRSGGEPEHDILELDRGSVSKNVNPKPRVSLPKDKRIALEEMIEKKSKAMAQEMAKKMLKDMVQESKEQSKEQSKEEKEDVEEKEKENIEEKEKELEKPQAEEKVKEKKETSKRSQARKASSKARSTKSPEMSVQEALEANKINKTTDKNE